VGEELVQHDLGIGVLLEHHHHAHALAVRLVAQVGDALNLSAADEVRDLLDQVRLVHLVGQFADDDPRAPLGVLVDLGAPAHHHAAAAGVEVVDDASSALDDAAGREVRPGHEFHQTVDPDLRVVEQGDQAVTDLGQVVGGYLGGHADRNAVGAVDQQVGDGRGHHRRHRARAVVVGNVVDGLLVEVAQDVGGDPGHAGFGISFRGGRVAVH